MKKLLIALLCISLSSTAFAAQINNNEYREGMVGADVFSSYTSSIEKKNNVNSTLKDNYVDEAGVHSDEVLPLSVGETVDTVTVTSMGITNRDAATVVPSNVSDSEDFVGTDYYNNFKIIKYYQLYDPIIGDVMQVGIYATLNATHDILIKDEQRYNNFKLKEWFITDRDWSNVDDTDGLSTNLYKDNKKSFNIIQEGNGEDIIHIPVEEADTKKALHILYTYEPINTQINVHKIYINKGQVERIEDSTLLKNLEGFSAITEPEYKCLAIRQYREPIELPTAIQEQIENPTALTEFNALDFDYYLPTIDTDVKVVSISDKFIIDPDYPEVYIVYTKDTTEQFTLYSNEISHVYQLSQLSSQPVTIYNYIQSALDGGATQPLCQGHIVNDKEYYCKNYNNGKRLVDSVLTLSAQDTFDYDKDTTNIRDYRVLNQDKLSKTYTTTWKGGNGEAIKLYPDARFILCRDSKLDKLTLYPNKNTSKIVGLMRHFGITNISYNPVERNLPNTTTDDNLYSTMETHWTTGDNSDNLLAWEWKLKGKFGNESHRESSHGIYGVSYEIGHSPSDANKAFGKENNIITKYYKPAPNTVLGTEQRKVESADALKVLYNNVAVFYPYTEYTCEYIEDDGSIKSDKVFVTEDVANEILLNGILIDGGYKLSTWYNYINKNNKCILAFSLPYIDIGGGIKDKFNAMQYISEKLPNENILSNKSKLYNYYTDENYDILLSDGENMFDYRAFDKYTSLGGNFEKALTPNNNTVDRNGSTWLKYGFDKLYCFTTVMEVESIPRQLTGKDFINN